MTTSPLDRSGAAWNEQGIWKSLAHAQHSYVPWDLPVDATLGPSEGEWIVDPYDGYRFFIPKAGTDSYTPEVLRSEAREVTNAFSHKTRWRFAVAESVRVPLAFATLGAVRPVSWKPESSSSYTISRSSNPLEEEDDDSTPRKEPPTSGRKAIAPGDIATPPPNSPPANPVPDLPRPQRPG